MSGERIFVIAHDGGCEGHSLPFLAFRSLDDARAYVACQEDVWSIAEVPIFPALPDAPWYGQSEIARRA